MKALWLLTLLPPLLGSVQKQVVQSTPLPQISFDLQDYKVISDWYKVPVLQPYNIRGVFKTEVSLQLWIYRWRVCKLTFVSKGSHIKEKGTELCEDIKAEMETGFQ